jgi:ribosome-associated protein
LNIQAAAAKNSTSPTKKSEFKESSDTLLKCIINSLSENKAEDITTIDLRGRTSIGDFMVVASGRSTRQVSSISQKLVDILKTDLGRLSKVEGKDAGDWVLIDTGDIIVHVFRPEVREFYQIEKMWAPMDQK